MGRIYLNPVFRVILNVIWKTKNSRETINWYNGNNLKSIPAKNGNFDKIIPAKKAKGM